MTKAVKRKLEFSIPIGDWTLYLSQCDDTQLVKFELCWKNKQVVKHDTAMEANDFQVMIEELMDNVPSSPREGHLNVEAEDDD